MRLKTIAPPLRDGQKVQCRLCGEMTGRALADLDGKPGTYYCFPCIHAEVNADRGDHEHDKED